MDQAWVNILLSALSLLAGVFVGRSTIKKQRAESDLISVQTFNSLREQVEKMQLRLAMVEADNIAKNETIRQLEEKVKTLSAENEALTQEIAKLRNRNIRRRPR